MNFSWAANYPELYTVCERFNLTEILNPTKVRYKSFESIIQEGPQCGLVALAMLLKNNTKEAVANLLIEAQVAKYTYNGEMFSAKDMFELTKRHLPKNVTLYKGLLNSDEIKDFLLDGGLMLVPYDCDRNHSPCQLKGHKAHWALITGIIETNTHTYVTAKQGKSKNIGIWSLSDLSESNAQLKEFSPDRRLHYISYKLPEDGLAGDNGLKCRAICVWPN